MFLNNIYLKNTITNYIMAYTYKGTDIKNLIVGGGSSLSNYGQFPPYKPASTYSTERPLTFGVEQGGVDVLNIMDASYIELTGSGTFTVPTDYNAFRAVLEGGGGGSGGGAGCGVNGTPNFSRKPYSNGGDGANGGFVFISDTPITSRTITYNVGTGGTGGVKGPQGGDLKDATQQATNPGTPGTPGNVSIINFTTNIGNYTATANAGTGGDAGDGNSGKSGTPAVTQVAINYQQSSLFNSDGNQQITPINSTINPLSYLLTRSNGADGGGQEANGTPGQPGYIRIYLLKD